MERVNSELIAAYGNFVHRVMSLSHRISKDENNPVLEFENKGEHSQNYLFYIPDVKFLQ